MLVSSLPTANCWWWLQYACTVGSHAIKLCMSMKRDLFERVSPNCDLSGRVFHVSVGTISEPFHCVEVVDVDLKHSGESECY